MFRLSINHFIFQTRKNFFATVELELKLEKTKNAELKLELELVKQAKLKLELKLDINIERVRSPALDQRIQRNLNAQKTEQKRDFLLLPTPKISSYLRGKKILPL